MTFAARTDHLQPEGAYRVLAQAQQLEAQGKDIIHLEIGQPYEETFSHIRQAGIRAIQSGKTRYTPPAGMPELRQIIAEYASRQRGISIQPQQVVVSPGAKPNLFFPTLALIEPGDEVLYPDPGFPTYPAMISVAGGKGVPLPMVEKEGFSVNLDTLQQQISDRTRMIILNSPANPTGAVISQQDLERIAALAREHDWWILSDEIYSRLCYTDDSAFSIASLPDLAERTVIVDGFSKSYAMTGWRLGYGIMPAPLARKVELLLTHATGSSAHFTQVAGIAALTTSQNAVREMVSEYQKRRQVMVEGLNAIQGVTCAWPQGAFYAFPNFKSFQRSSRELADYLLHEAGVAVLPGTAFGTQGEGYLRLSYANSLENLSRGLERLERALNKIR